MTKHQAAIAAIAELNKKALDYCNILRNSSNVDVQKTYTEFMNYVTDWRKSYKANHPDFPLPEKIIKPNIGLRGGANNVILTPSFATVAIDRLTNEIDANFNDLYGNRKIKGISQVV